MYEFWYDVETTGLKPKQHGILQISGLLVKDNKVIKEFDEFINPETYKRKVEIDSKALAINKLYNYKEFESAELVVKKLIHMLTTECPKDKVKLIGYNNSTFDKFFLEELFSDQSKSFSTYFQWKQVDVFELVKSLQHMGVMPKSYNQKLGTVGETFNIKLRGSLHNSLVDVYLTRDIYLMIKEKLQWK